MTVVYYWEDAVGEQDLLDTYQVAINKLLIRDYASADLEKLRGTTSENPVYSYRLNDTARLLFTTRKIQGKSYLQVLECLETHDYQKSRFLKKGVLKRYLESIPETLDFDTLAADEAHPAFETTEEEGHSAVGLQYFNQQFIRLNDDQNNAIHTTLPAIVLGAAGSGKTCTALIMLRHFIEEEASHPTPNEELRRILYVTKEATLVSDIRQVWEELAPSDEEGQVDVHTLTYEQLNNHILLPHPIKPKTEDTPEPFDAWFDNLKTNHLTKEQLWQEFRICSGYTEAEYRALGERQSLCPTHLREVTYQLYLRYLAYCEQQKIIDPTFQSLPDPLPEGYRYDLIVVDEAQNLSLKQQENLMRLAKNKAIAYCMDPSQNLEDQQPMRVLLENKYWNPETRTGINTVHLRQTYRCSQQVASTVTALMQAKQAIMGKIDKEEEDCLRVDTEAAAVGYVHLTKPSALNEHQAILARSNTNHFAVVTRPDFIEEARARFNTPLVFTPEQIQGLEYHTVVAYKLFSDNHSKQVLREIGPELEGLDPTSISPHRSKKGVTAHQAHAPWFSSLYTAYTRAAHTLLICEDELKHKSHNSLRDWLRQSTIDRKEASSPDMFPEHHKTDWAKEREKQIKHKNYAAAARIDEMHLNIKASEAHPATATSKTSPSKKSNRGKTTKTPSPTPNEQAVLELLNNFTKNGQLVEFRKKPVAHITTLLFTTRVVYGESEHKHSMLYHILSREDYTNRLILLLRIELDKFSEKSVIEKFIDHAQSNPLPRAMTVELCGMILSNKKLLKLEKARIWVSKSLEDKAVREGLILNSFTENLDTRQVSHAETLGAYMDAFINYKKLISTEHLGQLLTINKTPGDNDTALFFLGMLAFNGYYTLRLLIEKRPDVIWSIPADAWGRPRLSQSERLTNVSPLSMLLDSPGLDVISHIAQKYPEVIRGIPAEAWGLPLTEAADQFANSTPLHSLLFSEKGMNFLNLFISKFPDVIRAIPNNAWYRQLTKDTGSRKNLSPLNFLVCSEEGIETLERILANCPEVLLNIPQEEWHRRYTIDRISKNNTTPLEMLHNSERGRDFWHQFKQKRAEMTKSASENAYESLSMFATSDEDAPDTLMIDTSCDYC